MQDGWWTEMAKSATKAVDDTEGEIVLSTRAIIGRVPYSRYGTGSPVEAAFTMAGKYLSDQASDGNEAEVEFTFMGIRFFASTSTVNRPIDQGDDL